MSEEPPIPPEQSAILNDAMVMAAAQRILERDNPAREAFIQTEWEEDMSDKLVLRDGLQRSEAALEKEREARKDEEAAHTQTSRELRIRTEQAKKDKLTRLYNRYGFEEMLDKEIGHIRREGDADRLHHLVFFDLDKFKAANDAHGHKFGDAVLKGFSATLTDELTEKGHLVCRWGGEEFAALLIDTTDEEAVELAEHVGRLMRNTKFHSSNGEEYDPISVSSGVAPLKQRGEVEAALNQADIALYASKENGRNQVTLYAPGMKHNGDQNSEQQRRSSD